MIVLSGMTLACGEEITPVSHVSCMDFIESPTILLAFPDLRSERYVCLRRVVGSEKGSFIRGALFVVVTSDSFLFVVLVMACMKLQSVIIAYFYPFHIISRNMKVPDLFLLALPHKWVFGLSFLYRRSSSGIF